MNSNDIIKNVKPIKLTDDELRMYSDYSKSDARIARNEIWKCVENDQPIPHELKPILLELLQAPYKGMTKPAKATQWRARVSEVTYLTQGIEQSDYANVSATLTRKEAITLVAQKNILNEETLVRELVKPKHRDLIKTIKSLG